MQSQQKTQSDRFKRAAREAGADMDKEEFARVIGKIATPKPEKKPETDAPDNNS